MSAVPDDRARREIEELFAQYASGFDDADAAAIAACFAFPAVIWQLGEGHVFEDAEEIEENAEALIDVFDEAGIVLTTPETTTLLLAGGTAFATVDWRQEGQDGELLHAFRCHYTLIRHGEAWRIAVIVNDEPEGD
ncbi:nuclear transport factor 2 family protein [Propylenella binzhouense]|uniref:DUF4440 domain-containing protein n=1 Tax=Propylenella binzhouense TaxID=2555902 RepID=A0A964WSX7_9HYPH|nr:nuclear transport factor 2 family protein [Propylenella binzhouense]MYZ47434.1 DUF4440 domain-containing protein [Propylenella binzhouense]